MKDIFGQALEPSLPGFTLEECAKISNQAPEEVLAMQVMSELHESSESIENSPWRLAWSAEEPDIFKIESILAPLAQVQPHSVQVAVVVRHRAHYLL